MRLKAATSPLLPPLLPPPLLPLLPLPLPLLLSWGVGCDVVLDYN